PSTEGAPLLRATRPTRLSITISIRCCRTFRSGPFTSIRSSTRRPSSSSPGSTRPGSRSSSRARPTRSKGPRSPSRPSPGTLRRHRSALVGRKEDRRLGADLDAHGVAEPEDMALADRGQLDPELRPAADVDLVHVTGPLEDPEGDRPRKARPARHRRLDQPERLWAHAEEPLRAPTPLALGGR